MLERVQVHSFISVYMQLHNMYSIVASERAIKRHNVSHATM